MMVKKVAAVLKRDQFGVSVRGDAGNQLFQVFEAAKSAGISLFITGRRTFRH